MTHLTDNTAVTDTTDLRAAIELRAAAYFDAISAGATFAQQLALLPVIIRLYRLLLTIERRNRIIIVKARMLSNPVWRARVYAELGGWWGAKRWLDRMKASQIQTQNRPLKPAINASPRRGRTQPKKAQNYRRFKTDSLGQFRWATISRRTTHLQPRQIQRGVVAAPPTRASSSAPSASRTPPIPLTPQDFARADKAVPTASEIAEPTTVNDIPINTVRDMASPPSKLKGTPSQGRAPPH